MCTCRAASRTCLWRMPCESSIWHACALHSDSPPLLPLFRRCHVWYVHHDKGVSYCRCAACRAWTPGNSAHGWESRLDHEVVFEAVTQLAAGALCEDGRVVSPQNRTSGGANGGQAATQEATPSAAPRTDSALPSPPQGVLNEEQAQPNATASGPHLHTVPLAACETWCSATVPRHLHMCHCAACPFHDASSRVPRLTAGTPCHGGHAGTNNV